MNEAKFSFNIRFSIQGYDAQFTARDDESGVKLLGLVPQLLKTLEGMGATPERHWENGKNGKPEAQPVPAPTPEPELECPIHHKSAPSKFGGLYCPSKNKDGSYCDWKSEGGE